MCIRILKLLTAALLTALIVTTVHASDASSPDTIPKIRIVTPESVEKRLFSVDELLDAGSMTTEHFEAALDSWRGEPVETFHLKWSALLTLLDSGARSRRYEIRDQDLQRLARSRVYVPCERGSCDGIPTISRQTLLNDEIDRSIHSCRIRMKIRDGVIHKLKLRNRGCRFSEKEYLFFSTEEERRAAILRLIAPKKFE